MHRSFLNSSEKKREGRTWRNPWGGIEDVRLVVQHSRLFSHKWTVCFCFVIEENDFDFSYVKRRNAMWLHRWGRGDGRF